MTETQLEAVLSRLDTLSTQVSYLVERQKKQEELIDELVMPIAKEVMRTATTTLDLAEKKGYFAFGRELVGVAQRVVESYSADDVRELGNAVTKILDTVRAMTQPEVMAIANDASDVLLQAENTEPIGLLGMVRATGNEDVGRGIALTLEVLRRVGKGAKAMADRQDTSKRAKVNALLAPKRRAAKLPERPKPTNGNGGARVFVKPATELPPPAACATPSGKPVATAAVIDGVAFTADGHLVDASAWSKPLAESLAAAQGVQLTPEHWKIVEFARSDWESTKASPNIRRITLATGLQTKDLYGLFPKAPARTVAKIAGIPKPTGCL